jgi:hypothetical protein
MMRHHMPRPARSLFAPLATPAILAALAVGLCGCAERDTVELRISAQEQVLLDRLSRDPLLEIVDTKRNDDGYLVVSTRQGDIEAQYLLAPDGPASKQITIRRMDPGFWIESAVSPTPGVGPAERGIAH